LRHDELKPARDASVDPTEAPKCRPRSSPLEVRWRRGDLLGR
jgi:hypothetical protein